jgi:hypothetical protein
MHISGVVERLPKRAGPKHQRFYPTAEPDSLGAAGRKAPPRMHGAIGHQIEAAFRELSQPRFAAALISFQEGMAANDRRGLDDTLTLCWTQPPSFVSMKATRKPITVIRPAQFRASSNASGIIVSASIASMAPAASAVIAAMKSGDEFRNAA